mmetsp:Transcript_25297/g.28135  ORF Transcript_25297/g.28135 Transcript_25297/m.28135 type:complete len:93 (+) Transcript_25297:240-518(+)
MGVRINPGQTQFTLIPEREYSNAAPLVIPTTACFEAPYAALRRNPTIPARDAVLTIEYPEPPCFFIWPNSYFMHKNTLRTLTAITLSYSSFG